MQFNAAMVGQSVFGLSDFSLLISNLKPGGDAILLLANRANDERGSEPVEFTIIDVDGHNVTLKNVVTEIVDTFYVSPTSYVDVPVGLSQTSAYSLFSSMQALNDHTHYMQQLIQIRKFIVDAVMTNTSPLTQAQTASIHACLTENGLLEN